MSDYNRYQSPYSWRYASEEMRYIWSENNKRRLWRQLWVALAQAESEYGLVLPDQVEDLRAHAEEIDIPRALQIEAEIHHDLMAEVKAFGEKCTLGTGIIHLGATSMDIEDNADALRLRQSLDLILEKLGALLMIFAKKIKEFADLPVIAFTHLQPAEPSTLGYRLALYAQDLLADFEVLYRTRLEIRGKGFKGAVGTSASYGELVGADQIENLENRLSELLGIPFFPVASQTYPRKQDYFVLNGLAGMGASLYKFAFDLRLLQSPTIGELSEPFGEKQVGSSAMPFKRNPINAEKMDSLARLLAQMPEVAWQNAAHSHLERTLDDSANRRTLLPEAFLISDELLKTASRILRGLQVNKSAIARNLATYAPFASTERVLMALAKSGANRQDMHERLRSHAMIAWQAVREGQPNPLVNLLAQDPMITGSLSAEKVKELMDIDQYTGAAPQRARELARTIQDRIQSKEE
ncbi:MAG: adenylosuccinate lyase [Anaerolineaceae bacterium]|nr:adenylosuccinate lyase [Anaerolineaceae bacterium]